MDRQNELDQWFTEKIGLILSKSLDDTNVVYQELVNKTEEKNQTFENAQESNTLALTIHQCLSQNKNVWNLSQQ